MKSKPNILHLFRLRQLLKPHFVASLSGSMILGCSLVQAKPLEKNACEALSVELRQLAALNAEKLMDKGPEWAVSHLSVQEIARVRRYIEANEQYKFRCLPPSAPIKLGKVIEEDEEASPPSSPTEATSPKEDEKTASPTLPLKPTIQGKGGAAPN